jgi:hypothetical protein
MKRNLRSSHADNYSRSCFFLPDLRRRSIVPTPAVISRTPVCHLITRPSSSKWLARPAITRRCLQNADFVQSLSITSKMLTSFSNHSALPLKRWYNVQSLGITSKMLTLFSNHSALPLKRWYSVQSLGVASKMPTSPSSQLALPIKRWYRVQSLGITSKMLMSLSNHSALPLKHWYSVQSLGVASKTPTSPFNRSVLPLKRWSRPLAPSQVARHYL